MKKMGIMAVIGSVSGGRVTISFTQSLSKKKNCHKTSLNFNTLGRHCKIPSKEKNQFPFQIKGQFRSQLFMQIFTLHSKYLNRHVTKIDEKCLIFIMKFCQHQLNHRRLGVHD